MCDEIAESGAAEGERSEPLCLYYYMTTLLLTTITTYHWSYEHSSACFSWQCTKHMLSRVDHPDLLLSTSINAVIAEIQ